MIPINNSDTAWLIVTDYNQDNDLPYLDLRNDIISPDVNLWCFEFRNGIDYGGVGYDGNVGSYMAGPYNMGYNYSIGYDGVGCFGYNGVGEYVGGYASN